MKLFRVRIRNFRCFKEEISVDFGNITALIGKNDAGKSSILEALAVFFEDQKPDPDDACVYGDPKDVHVACEFSDLPDFLVLDADARTSLMSEYLLNAAGRLEIHKIWDCSLKTPKISRTYAVAAHPTKEGYKDLLSLKISELKARAKELGVDLDGVDQKVNSAIRARLWGSGGELSLEEQEIALDLEGTRKMWDQLKLAMPVFGLFKSDRSSTDQDDEAQDPMKLAVKEAIKAKQQELDDIANYVKDEVSQIARQTVAKLAEMDPALASNLEPQFSNPSWASVFKIALTDDSTISVNKRGSGVRRLILLNFFRAKCEAKLGESDASGVIYAVEEPETSQHPDNQRMLLRAFQELAQQPNCQVILTTHTPNLARQLPVDSIRYLDVGSDKKRTLFAGDDDTLKMVSQALGVMPDHNVKLFIGVEGINDINFLKEISLALIKDGTKVLDLAALEDEGKVVFIPLGGTNLGLWVRRLEPLNCREFHLFDRDEQPPDPSRHQQAVVDIKQRGGCDAALTGKREIENYLHPDVIDKLWPGVTVPVGDFTDVPVCVAEQVHAKSSPDPWSGLSPEKQKKKVSRAKARLCSEGARLMNKALLGDQDPQGDVIGWLRTISQMVNDAPLAGTAPVTSVKSTSVKNPKTPSAKNNKGLLELEF